MSLSTSLQNSDRTDAKHPRHDKAPAPPRKRTHRDKAPTPAEHQPRPRTHTAVPPAPQTSPRGREWRDPAPKWIRRVRADRWQLRVPVGQCRKGIYPLNCGCYPSSGEAVRVRRVVIRVLSSGGTAWDALTQLIVTGEASAFITARFVYAVSGGYGVKARSRGRVVDLPGPYPSAKAARDAAAEGLRV